MTPSGEFAPSRREAIVVPLSKDGEAKRAALPERRLARVDFGPGRRSDAGPRGCAAAASRAPGCEPRASSFRAGDQLSDVGAAELDDREISLDDQMGEDEVADASIIAATGETVHSAARRREHRVQGLECIQLPQTSPASRAPLSLTTVKVGDCGVRLEAECGELRTPFRGISALGTG